MSGETKPARIPALAAMPANADGARRPVLRCSHRPGWVDESGDHGRERVLFDSEFTAFNLCFTAVLSFDRGGVNAIWTSPFNPVACLATSWNAAGTPWNWPAKPASSPCGWPTWPTWPTTCEGNTPTQ